MIIVPVIVVIAHIVPLFYLLLKVLLCGANQGFLTGLSTTEHDNVEGCCSEGVVGVAIRVSMVIVISVAVCMMRRCWRHGMI